jgi:hypothetical protein
LHLLSASQTSRLSGSGGICVFVRDVDAVYAELAARGARIVKPPQNKDYGMRDFDLIDLDGNQLTSMLSVTGLAGCMLKTSLTGAGYIEAANFRSTPRI